MTGEQSGSSRSVKPVFDDAKPTAPLSLRQLLASRSCLLCCGLALFLLTACQLCGKQTIVFLSVLLSDGVIAASWIAGAVALGSVLLRRLKMQVNGPLHIATAGGLGLGIYSLCGLGLGLLAWLNRPVAILFPVASLLLRAADHYLFRATPVLSYPSARRLPQPDLNAPRKCESAKEDAKNSNPVLSLLRVFLLAFAPSRRMFFVRKSRQENKKRGDLNEEPVESETNPALRNTSEPASTFKQWLLSPAGASWLWLVPVVSLTIALVSASMMPGILWKPLDPHPYDVTGYHLLVPREWYEGGRIVPLEHNVYSFFEFNVEIQFLLLMHAMGGPWAAMYACQFVCVAYAALMVLAVLGAASINAENRSSAFAFSPVLAAALASSIPWVIMLAGVAYVESALMLYTALAIAWAMDAIHRPDHFIRSLTLSGILAGLACGVKITAVPMLLLAVPVGTFVVLIKHRPDHLTIRRLMIGCAALLLAGSIAVSPWLIRNFIWAGNPLFPVGMKVLGRDHFDDVQVKRFHDAHSPTENLQPFAAKIALLWRDVISHWQFGYFILPGGLLACFVRWRDRQSWLIFICGAFVLVVWIGFTHLLPRFLVMLIPIAAMAIGRIHWGRAWPAAAALLLITAGLAWSKVIPELTRQPAVIGVEDLTQLLPPELLAERDSQTQIGLVGDAQAFLYQIPLSRLHYRAVFNLHTGTDDPIQAWLGTEPIGNPNWLLMINPNEIERLHATYYGVPAPPADWASHGSNDFFVRGDQLQKR